MKSYHFNKYNLFFEGGNIFFSTQWFIVLIIWPNNMPEEEY